MLAAGQCLLFQVARAYINGTALFHSLVTTSGCQENKNIDFELLLCFKLRSSYMFIDTVIVRSSGPSR
jgi:hypothetical protein